MNYTEIFMLHHTRKITTAGAELGMGVGRGRQTSFCPFHSGHCARASEVPSHPDSASAATSQIPTHLLPLHWRPSCVQDPSSLPMCPSNPGPQPASFHWTPHSMGVQSPCPRLTALVPPPLPSPPMAHSLLCQANGVISPFPRCHVVLFPGAVPPSFPLLLPPLQLAWGRKGRRKQQHQE